MPYKPDLSPPRLQLLRASIGLTIATVLLAGCAPGSKDPYEAEIRDTARYIMGDMSQDGFLDEYELGDKELRAGQELHECRPDDHIVQISEISGVQKLEPWQQVLMPVAGKIQPVREMLMNSDDTTLVRVVQRHESNDSGHDDIHHFDAELKMVDGHWKLKARYLKRVLTGPDDYDVEHVNWIYPEQTSEAIPLELSATKVLDGSDVPAVLSDIRESYDEIRTEGACGTPPAVRK